MSSNRNKGVLLPNTLVTGSNNVPVQLVNDGLDPIYLKKGQVLAYAVECDVVLQDSEAEVKMVMETNVTHSNSNLDNLIIPEHLENLYHASVKKLLKCILS